jgi:hypothetical protein
LFYLDLDLEGTGVEREMDCHVNILVEAEVRREGIEGGGCLQMGVRGRC